MRTIAFFSLFAFASLTTLYGQSNVDLTKKLTVGIISPDAKFKVCLAEEPSTSGEGRLLITNLTTGVTDSSIQVRHVYFLGWNSDSQSFVMVEHIANGQTVDLCCYDGANWMGEEYCPTSSAFLKWHVLNLTLTSTSLYVKFVGQRLKSGHNFSFFTYENTVNIPDLELQNVRWTNLSESEYKLISSKAIFYGVPSTSYQNYK